MSKRFPRELKLGKYKGVAHLEKLNRVLPKARFVYILLIFDDVASKGSVNLAVLTHGKRRVSDVMAVVDSIENVFDVVIPAVGVVVDEEHCDVCKRKRTGYIA